MSNMSLSMVVSMFDQYSAPAAKFKRTLKNMKKQVHDFGRGLKSGVQAELFPRFQQERFASELRTMEDRVSKSQARLRAGAAQLLLLAAPIKMAADFDQSFKGLEKVVDAPISRLKELRKFALSTSALIPIAAKDIIELMAEAAQGGVAQNELEKFALYVSNAAIAFDMAGAEIGERFAKLKNVYKLNQSGIEDLGDATNHLSNNMAAKAAEITNFTNRAAGAASILHLSATQMSAVGAAMIAAGIVPETAARGISSFAAKVIAGGKKVDGAFKLLGTSRKQYLKDLEKDGPEAVKRLFETMANHKDGKKALVELFGMDFADDFSKLLGNPELLATALSLIADKSSYAGSAVEEAGKQAEGARKKFDLLINKLVRAAIVIGDVLLPPLLELADQFGKVIDKIAEFAAANPEMFSMMVKAAAMALALSIGLKVLSFAWAVVGLNIFKVLGWLLRFNKAGRNVSIIARGVRLLGRAMKSLSPLRWASLIPKLSWLLFIPKFAWALFFTPIKWALFIPKLIWKALISPFKWLAFIPKLAWKALISPFKWLAFVPKLAWKALIAPFKWLAFVPKLAWSALISPLKWLSFLPKLSWRLLIPLLKFARFIPHIGWALLLGELAWSLVIKPLGWDKFLNIGQMKKIWGDLEGWLTSKFDSLREYFGLSIEGGREKPHVTNGSKHPRNGRKPASKLSTDAETKNTSPSSKSTIKNMLDGMFKSAVDGQGGLKDGAQSAANTLENAGTKTGQNAGNSAEQILRSAAPAIGAAIGQAAAAEVRKATVNIKVQSNGSQNGTPGQTRRNRGGALHDGGDGE